MLTKEELLRYSRHIKMSNVGTDGQQRLKNAKVLVIGAGGLGCPVLQYLTAAGIGIIGIIDDDVVDISNLQRQILFDSNDVGQSKVDVAISRLSAQNPFVKFRGYKERLTRENAVDVFMEYDIIIDGTDNFPTRYLVNDACIIAGKPLVFGSIYQFEGQVSVFNYNNGPSYRCLYPNPPASGEVPNCSQIGVLGILPGVIGTRMAAECIKIVLQIGTTLSGELLVMDLLENRNLQLKIRRNESNFERKALETDYEFFCGINSEKESNLDIEPEVLSEYLNNGRNLQLIDVREPFEFDIVRMQNSINIPLGEIAERKAEIDMETEAIFICHHGIRSLKAIEILQKSGYSKLLNLKGGIDSWSVKVAPDLPRY